jgi:hypothetical protein
MAAPSARGFVVVLALMVMLLLSALAAAYALVVSSDVVVAHNLRMGEEARRAAESAAEVALADLDALADWSLALSGAVRSSFVDGPPSGVRALDDGSRLDLDELVSRANCRSAGPCSAADMDAVTADRPWGRNNPRWRPFLYGRLRALAPGSESPCYVVVMIADDPSEIDGDPARDADWPAPGAGVVLLRAQAFGPRGVRRIVEASAGRSAGGRVRVIAWRPQ